MCINRVNTTLFESMIDMADDYIDVGYRWIRKMAHMSGDCGFVTVSEKLRAAQLFLTDPRDTGQMTRTC